ncbi:MULTISPECIES: hypothetical protein [unclassified Polaribacter]|uniref:hypothetical protein n=1 Tax=unclassified Polaribacter TaxID=196858 RepID=UPI0011BE087C|nr:MULTISPECIES: hypothetical protein [unclassified Polaribacter]TXD52968.1 hypothetical protein ES043_06240 [Polaribacter sp. IC063]TXD60940.1 hypothetical protein ES044_06225 [Polaribacter sp. IC066]
MNYEKFFTQDSKGDGKIEQELLFDEANALSLLNLSKNEIFRIEENQTEGFSGVRSCSKPEVHNSNANVALQR